jgi:hypothetical protein
MFSKLYFRSTSRRIVVGTGLHGLHRRLDAAVGSDQNHVSSGDHLLEGPEDCHPVHIGQLDIEDGQVVVRLFGFFQGVPSRPGRLHPVAFPLEDLREEMEHVHLVVNH